MEIAAVTAQLVALGVRRGGVLLVHASFRAVRPVDGGPLGVVAALRAALGDAGTLVMPTMTDGRVHDLDGQVLLLGVHHSENTTLHLAEAVAGVPYAVSHPTVVEIDGVATTVVVAETDHCCNGFRVLDAWLGDRQRVGSVGYAQARLCRSRDVVAAAVERLRANPVALLCAPNSGCDECDAAHASITAPESTGPR